MKRNHHGVWRVAQEEEVISMHIYISKEGENVEQSRKSSNYRCTSRRKMNIPQFMCGRSVPFPQSNTPTCTDPGEKRHPQGRTHPSRPTRLGSSWRACVPPPGRLRLRQKTQTFLEVSAHRCASGYLSVRGVGRQGWHHVSTSSEGYDTAAVCKRLLQISLPGIHHI